MALKEAACKAAKPKEKDYKLTDGNGLYLHVMPNGARYWRYKYRFLKKQRVLALGVYPETSLSEAREKHRQAHKLVTQGIDPSVIKQDVKKQQASHFENTFQSIAREWYDLKKPDWSDVNAETVLKRLEKDVFPVIGKTPIKTINHKTLLDLANSVKERGAHELAKRIIQMCRHIYQYAVVTGRAEKNIAEDLKGLVKSEPKSHYAAIEARDLPQFIADLRNHKIRLNRQTFLAVNLMMLTFVRTGEMIKAEWSEFDFDAKIWIVPAQRMKMKKDHIVPLSNQAVEVLKELRELHTHPRYVFPSRKDGSHHMSNNTILMALDRMGYRGKMTGHGFRALAMSTIMEKLHYRHEVPDAQLAHAKRGDVARAYDRAKFIPERTVMMQEWADYLDNIAQNGTVIVGKFSKSA